MGVTDRGFRAWKQRPPSQRQRRDMVILAHIREQHRRSLGSYGRATHDRRTQRTGSSRQVQDLGAPRNTDGIVRRTSACLVGQPGWAIRPKPRQQPKHLPPGQAEQAGGIFGAQATGLHFGQHFDPVQLALAHHPPAHVRPPRIMLQPGE